MQLPYRTSSRSSNATQAAATHTPDPSSQGGRGASTLRRTSSVRYPQGRPRTSSSSSATTTLAGADLYGVGVHPDDAQSSSISRAHEASASAKPGILRRTNEIRRPRGYTHTSTRTTRAGSQTSQAAIYEYGLGREGEILAQQYSRSYPDEGEAGASFAEERRPSLRRRIGESLKRNSSKLARSLSGRGRGRGGHNPSNEGGQEPGPGPEPEPDLSRNNSGRSRSTTASASERFRTNALPREEEREGRYHTGEPIPPGPDLTRAYGTTTLTNIRPSTRGTSGSSSSQRDRDPYHPRDRTRTRTRANTTANTTAMRAPTAPLAINTNRALPPLPRAGSVANLYGPSPNRIITDPRFTTITEVVVSPAPPRSCSPTPASANRPSALRERREAWWDQPWTAEDRERQDRERETARRREREREEADRRKREEAWRRGREQQGLNDEIKDYLHYMAYAERGKGR